MSRLIGVAKGLHSWRARYWIVVYDDRLLFLRREVSVDDPETLALRAGWRLLTDPSGKKKRQREMDAIQDLQPAELLTSYAGSVVIPAAQIGSATLSPRPRRGSLTIDVNGRRTRRFRLARAAEPRRIAALLKESLGSRFRDLTEGPIRPLSRSF